MIEIVGVRFKPVGKIYYFDPGGLQISKGANVIVETSRGIEYGKTEIPNRFVSEDSTMPPLKMVLRLATEEDDEQYKSNLEKEKNALVICKEKIIKHNLDMKLVDIEFTFDLNKVIFYFTSEGRVDFRELVKDLASVFRTRIELRQIGVRDEAKILNGIGICGNTLCCSTFLSEFQPVSIKMAKEQNLSLKPSKISGICGRLMCCLKYEEENYHELNRILPCEGDTIKTIDGVGEVISVNTLRKIVKASVRTGPKEDVVINTYKVDDITIIKRKKNKDTIGELSKEEMEELKSILEKD